MLAYRTCLIFVSKLTGEVVVCYDTDGPDCTSGFHLPTLGM